MHLHVHVNVHVPGHTHPEENTRKDSLLSKNMKNEPHAWPVGLVYHQKLYIHTYTCTYTWLMVSPSLTSLQMIFSLQRLAQRDGSAGAAVCVCVLGGGVVK